MAQIFLDDIRHRHTQGCGKILSCHALLLFRILQQFLQAVGEALGVACWEEFNRQFLALRHLAEVCEIGTDNWHPVSTGQMRHSAAPGRRGIWHHSHARRLKQISQVFFLNVAAKFNTRVTGTLLPYPLGIALRLRMISTGNHQLGIWHSVSKLFESLDHQLEPLVGSPFAKCENATNWVSTAREIRKLRAARQDSMGAQVDIVAAVLIVQDLAITGHEYRDGVRQQQHARCHRTRGAI